MYCNYAWLKILLVDLLYSQAFQLNKPIFIQGIHVSTKHYNYRYTCNKRYWHKLDARLPDSSAILKTMLCTIFLVIGLSVSINVIWKILLGNQFACVVVRMCWLILAIIIQWNSNITLLAHVFPYSQHLSAYQCMDNVMRNKLLNTWKLKWDGLQQKTDLKKLKLWL